MQYIITYFTEFRKNAIEEIKAVDLQAVCEKLTWETSMVSTRQSAFIEALKASEPIFIRHIMPIENCFELAERKEKDLRCILEQVRKIFKLSSAVYFTVQARVIEGKGDYNAKDVEIYLGEFYEEQGGIPVFSDDHIINYEIDAISIFIKGKTCYIGCSKTVDNLNFQSNEYRVLGKQPPEICRAENKLKEAISKFKVQVNGKGYALDVGAAPGGWTKVLADYGYQVCAVDPGELDERLKHYENIVHYKARIQELSFKQPFNLVTCDMNVDALIAAKLMCQLHNKIAEGGYGIITLKLPFKDEEKRIQKSIEILQEKFEVLTVKNLTHNRREVTVYMQLKTQKIS